MSQASPDLMQVSALFNECISRVRNRRADDLDGAAEEWLKSAQYDVMKTIEERYYELSQNANDTLNVPHWAINPKQPLRIVTPDHPRSLDKYSTAFIAAFTKLLNECGFNNTVQSITWSTRTHYYISIYFPATLPPPSHQLHSPTQVAQQFDCFPKISATVLRITQGIDEAIITDSGESPF